ncbi:MAG: glutamine-hydrolyzing GMP synthase [Gammaproteobacteria bacterium RIFCSPHIGHO2_12_FULL_38_14]|nr:MAG: glutamine-hydrolyzing GMP synthase [Gammaproteobacteria bacterium RIFCSPHIGHO2_12_FULL_38_14]
MTTTIHTKRILILDFGSQYTQVIARRVREIGVYCEVRALPLSDDEILNFNPAGIILSGGPETVTGNETPTVPNIIFTLGKPMLGICYGMQAMAQQLGGQVLAGSKREFGRAEVMCREPSLLLHDIQDRVSEAGLSILDVWMSHGDHVEQLPPGFKIIASTEDCSIVGMADDTRHFYGLQFHPEVSHTLQGKRILERFLLEICACSQVWTTKNIIEEQIAHIRKTVGQDNVILGLSGGLDSSVAALLLHQAIGKQLTCVFIDTGLLRLHEPDQVKAIFGKHFDIDLVFVDARKQFYDALESEGDPERKRKMIGKVFIEVFNDAAKKIENVVWLAQGTIYSDVIESAGTKNGKAHVIKSHHNVGGLPDHMPFKLLEPLRELFKDEVREIGLMLGLPHELAYRHPFPGPGLGIRVLGEIKPEYVEKLRQADAILIEELHTANLYYKVSQAFAVFLPVKSVGVIGDARHYDHVISIRIVETIDFMTAHWAKVPYPFLEKVSTRIINEVKGISRVTYDISNKPPATIEWE